MDSGARRLTEPAARVTAHGVHEKERQAGQQGRLGEPQAAGGTVTPSEKSAPKMARIGDSIRPTARPQRDRKAGLKSTPAALGWIVG